MRKNQRGIALIIVLLMVSIIIALTLQLNRDSRSEAYDAANRSDGIRLRYVAQSGFHVGEALILGDKNASDGLTDLWANTEMISLKSEDFFRNASFRLTIEDETGRIPVNRLLSGSAYNPLIRECLMRLLTGPYFRWEERRAAELLDAIKDWIDADDEVTGSGAESAYYAKLESPYAAKNAPLDCIEELLMVKGITRELYYGTSDSPGLARCLTVFGDGPININTAPKPVLRSLAVNMTGDDADALDRYRRDPRNDLADPLWYQRVSRLSGMTIPLGLTSVQSDTFRITAVGYQDRAAERVTGVVKRGGDRRRVTLLSWKVE